MEAERQGIFILVPTKYLRNMCIIRLIVIIFFITFIIDSVKLIAPMMINRISNQLFPTNLATSNLNYWVCPQIVKCKNSNCSGEGGYGQFVFRAYFPANAKIPDGTYEFASGESNINAGPSNIPVNARIANLSVDNTGPPELFCEYGISFLGLGPAKIDMLAFAPYNRVRIWAKHR